MIEEMKYKTCNKCGVEKPHSDYYKNKARKDGVSVYCITCSKEYYKKPERIEYDKERQKRRSKTKEYKEYQTKYQIKLNKVKYQNNDSFKIRTRMRNLINKYIKRKQKSTNDIIGCSYQELINHLEKQFQPGMSWDNYGDWHIDHIIPQSLGKTDEEIYKLNHYSNLQPLWAKDNLQKSNKISQELGND